MSSIKEVAEKLAEGWTNQEYLNAKLAEQIAQALRDERERCRKLAQSWEHRSDVNPARAIASAIQQGVEP